jgi:hypothetical protein
VKRTFGGGRTFPGSSLARQTSLIRACERSFPCRSPVLLPATRQSSDYAQKLIRESKY